MEKVNVFLVSIRSANKLLWKNVPIETAKRLCSLDETRLKNSMMVWTRQDTLGLLQENAIDSGRFDHLLTDEEKRIIHYFDGKQWRPKLEDND